MSARLIISCALIAMAAVLSGCANDAASYLANGREHALTLVRAQPYFWSRHTELALVLARFPDCQRRHSLKTASDGDARAELYELEPGRYLLKRGPHWYFANTAECTVQFVAAPQQGYSGRLLGKFTIDSGKLQFVPAPVTSDQTR